MKHLKYVLVVMLNGAKRNEASQICTANRDSKAYGTLRERFAQNDKFGLGQKE